MTSKSHERDKTDLGHHRWLQLKVTEGKPNGDMTVPFDHLVTGDGDSAAKHREFYNEYRSVMDLTAEFFLQTIYTVFVKHALPKGEMKHRAMPVDLSAIRRVGLLTVEGENDDISGIGQTLAPQDLCQTLPHSMKADYLQEKVRHYGVFNGSRFRNEIVPRLREPCPDKPSGLFLESGGNGRDKMCQRRNNVQARLIEPPSQGEQAVQLA